MQRFIKTIDDGNTNFDLVYLENNIPHCKIHGAMLKVSEAGYWRCIRAKGQKDCRAGCEDFAGYCPKCNGIVKMETRTGNFKTFKVGICRNCEDQVTPTPHKRY